MWGLNVLWKLSKKEEYYLRIISEGSSNSILVMEKLSQLWLGFLKNKSMIRFPHGTGSTVWLKGVILAFIWNIIYLLNFILWFNKVCKVLQIFLVSVSFLSLRLQDSRGKYFTLGRVTFPVKIIKINLTFPCFLTKIVNFSPLIKRGIMRLIHPCKIHSLSIGLDVETWILAVSVSNWNPGIANLWLCSNCSVWV